MSDDLAARLAAQVLVSNYGPELRRATERLREIEAHLKNLDVDRGDQ